MGGPGRSGARRRSTRCVTASGIASATGTRSSSTFHSPTRIRPASSSIGRVTPAQMTRDAPIQERAPQIVRALSKAYPDAHVALRFSNPLEMLVATILSAQCTDEKVNEVTATLFRKYRSAKDYLNVP